MNKSKRGKPYCFEIYVCEQCGKEQENASFCLAKVFGQVFFFCSYICRNYWLDDRIRRFSDPSKRGSA